MVKLLQNVTVVDPQSKHNGSQVDIRIIDGRIKTIAAAGSISPAEGEECIQGEGLHVSPGWVDMGCHLSDPGFEHKESLEALAQAAAFGGFTDVLCYPNTQPASDDSSAIKALVSRAHGLDAQLHFMGAITEGANSQNLAELFDMQKAGALAFSDGRHSIQSSSLLLRSMQYSQAFDGLMIMYPVDEDLAKGAQMNESETSVYLGMKGAPELAETAAVSNLLHIQAYGGGNIHLQPLTSAAAINAAAEHHVTTAVSIAHVAWDDSVVMDFDTHFKINPPLRDKKQKAALLQTIADGKVDAFCSYHQAQGLEEKLVEWPYAEPGMLALQTFFPLAMEHLVRPGIISLERLISMLTYGPRDILGLALQSIEEGHEASVTLFQPEADWEFDRKAIFSRAVNSPLLGKTLRGKAWGLTRD
ncbi:MAG: dihydroorotase family protein [Bacteroidia bacterium]